MICDKCGNEFSRYVKINGKRHHLSSSRKYCINCKPLGTCRKSKIELFTKEELQKIIDNSNTYIEVLSKCGLSNNSNNYNTLNKIIKELEIDLTKINKNRKKYQDRKRTIYTNDNIYEKFLLGEVKGKPSKLLNLMVDFNIKTYTCEICGINKWQNKDIRLELHHIDGNRQNNKIENLQILCPNCHSQTDNFRFKNKHGKEEN